MRNIMMAFIILCMGCCVLANTPCENLRILQPLHISATDTTCIQFEVSSGIEQTVPYQLVVEDEEGMVTTQVSGSIPLGRGTNRRSILIAPEVFSSFSLGEDLILSLSLDNQEASVDATLLSEATSTATSSWSINFQQQPVMLYTATDRTVYCVVQNPKPKGKTASIVLKFLNSRNKKKAALAPVSIQLNPGENIIPIVIPYGTSTSAHSYSCTKAKAVLKVAGIVRATNTAPIDFDLEILGDLDPVSGIPPLDVFFTCEGSGGVPPYSYSWDFGDGSPPYTLPQAWHTYEEAGEFTASITLTDSVGGTVTDFKSVSVTHSGLTVTCTATRKP